MSVKDTIVGFFTIDRYAQRKRVVKNCVDLLFESYIGKEKISTLETAMALNEVRNEVFERLNSMQRTEENKIENIKFAIQNIEHGTKTS